MRHRLRHRKALAHIFAIRLHFYRALLSIHTCLVREQFGGRMGEACESISLKPPKILRTNDDLKRPPVNIPVRVDRNSATAHSKVTFERGEAKIARS